MPHTVRVLRTAFLVALMAMAATPLLAASSAGAATDDGQGCTPGYWKNHVDNWQNLDRAQTVDSVFAVPVELADLGARSLEEALAGGGGRGLDGAAKILVRAGTAAALNAGDSDVAYPLTVDEVVERVDDALESLDRGTMLDVAEELDALNNLGCPLGQTREDDGGDDGGDVIFF